MAYLLDTCALIAFLTGEPGADEVENALNEHECHTHSLMLYELFKDTLRRTAAFDEAEALMQDLADIGLGRTEVLGDDVLKEAAAVRLSAGRMSMVDAFGVALATLNGWIFLTSDRGELQSLHDAGKPIEFFRP